MFFLTLFLFVYEGMSCCSYSPMTESNRKFNLLHRTKLVAIFSGVELTKTTFHVVMYVR